MDTSRPSTFSIGPPSSSSPEDPNDSGLIDDNDLTTGLLIDDNENNVDSNDINNNEDDDDDDDENNNETTNSPSSRRFVAAATRRHSIVRLIMRKIGTYLASGTLMAMLLLVPIIIYRALSDRKLDIAAWHSALIMVGGTLILSARLIYLHFTHWYMPGVQKYVVRIILMVPLYAVQSWLSLRFHHARIYIDTIRDLYEAFVIASFVYYLIELLGGEEAMVQILRQKVRIDPSLNSHLGHHAFPLSLVLEPWDLGVEFMLQCKHGVLQYVVAKTAFTILTYIFQSLGMYGEGEFVWTSPYPYLAFLMNISVMYALYSLVKLFHAVHDELRHPIDWHPLGKFLCVKGVVFFTWWQGVLIFYLKAHGIIDDIEMVGFAIAHSFTFTYKEYLPSTVEEAIVGYEEVRQLPSNNSGSGSMEDNNNDADGSLCESRRLSYHPPEMLARPMKFKDAFWSSTLPSETLHDIRRLQNGVNHAAAQVNDPGTISLQGLSSPANLDEDNRPDPQQHDV